MIDFYLKYAGDYYSQNGEDKIIEEVFNRIKAPDPMEVAEFGAHDGTYCSNTRYWLEQGAHGTWVEADEDLYQKAKEVAETVNVDLYCTFVTPENVNELIPAKPDLLSIDTDGPDYGIWKAYRGRARVVIIEINSSYAPMVDRVESGANYSAMVKMGLDKGYFLLCHSGNCIFIRNFYRDKFPEIVGDGLKNWQEYFNAQWLQ